MARVDLQFGRAELLAAFDRLAERAIENNARLDIAVYGGSALMLASNFRFSTEDVDIGPIPKPWPAWLDKAVADIASEMRISQDWLNDAVGFHLSSLAEFPNDHLEFGTFPRGSERAGLSVFVPKPDYMLAMKLKAMRINDPAKGKQESSDILNLMEAMGVNNEADAMAVLEKYYPRSAQHAERYRFLLRHLMKSGVQTNAPEYPTRGL